MEIKHCPYCELDKPVEEFLPNRRRCKECRRVESNKWFMENKESRYKRVNKNKQDLKLRIVNHFGNQCRDCGQSFPPCVYDLHHLDPAKKEIAIASAFSWDKVKDELEKCVMLCANCHRIHHHAERSRG